MVESSVNAVPGGFEESVGSLFVPVISSLLIERLSGRVVELNVRSPPSGSAADNVISTGSPSSKF